MSDVSAGSCESKDRPLHELDVISSSNKLSIQNMAVFGDAEDIFIKNPIESSGGTITFSIDVRRKFMPGNYVMHIVGPDPTVDSSLCKNRSAILCREDVDPKLIHELLINSNCERNGKHLNKNFISRYDWMHFRNWGDFNDSNDEHLSDDSYKDESFESIESLSSEEDTKKLSQKLKEHVHKHFHCNPKDFIFFVNANNVDDEILHGSYKFERENESISIIKSTKNADVVIGFIIQVTKDNGLIAGDWHYGCLLTDKGSDQNFAFIFGDLYLHAYLEKEDSFVKYDIQKDDFTYNINKFFYKK